MLQRLALFYSNHIKPHLFLHQEEDKSLAGYKNLHDKKIKLAGQDILNTALGLDMRVQAVHHVGLLAYTGGYASATCAAEYMPTMVDFLKSPSLSDDQRVSVLEGLTGICYVHLANQQQAHSLGLYTTIQDLLASASPPSTRVKLWSCYLLNTLCLNNVPVIRTLAGSESLRRSLEALEGQDWFGWPKNYAQELLYMLGFWTCRAEVAESQSSSVCRQRDACID